ncbi:O-methyltransferase [Nocardia yamanashiensis]|uniref:O-methyltransferase n=1 Tax=Nocardia yamanashiensis TaxID=209247 RepID=UPI00082BB878|nr:class I SAM-dependent methyltransferase [Nocardia yamanashiensis]
MNSLTTSPVAEVLDRLIGQANVADKPLHDSFADGSYSVEQMLQDDRCDFRKLCHDQIDNFLNIDPNMGKFLYLCARGMRAERIVEFGTSFGISSIYLTCALKDNGGGKFIGTELESVKAVKAVENLEAAGLGDLAEVRVGDARETLRGGVGGPIDLLLLDGAYHLYLPVLRLLEPNLATNAIVVADNAQDLDNAYLSYVQDAGNGYMTLPLPFHPERGNYISVYTGVEA